MSKRYDNERLERPLNVCSDGSVWMLSTPSATDWLQNGHARTFCELVHRKLSLGNNVGQYKLNGILWCSFMKLEQKEDPVFHSLQIFF